jgi:serine/threonine-protein kinase
VAGLRFGKYELVRRLGHGGMAEVYLARQAGPAGFEKQVVLKQVLPQHGEKAHFRQMFLDEARLAARLSHPNICQVFDLGEVDGRPFLAMEYVDGLTLSQLLSALARRGLRMPLDATLRVLGAVLEALHAAHTLTDEAGQALQVVHRDVTPSNIMVTGPTEPGSARTKLRKYVCPQASSQVNSSDGPAPMRYLMFEVTLTGEPWRRLKLRHPRA